MMVTPRPEKAVFEENRKNGTGKDHANRATKPMNGFPGICFERSSTPKAPDGFRR